MEKKYSSKMYMLHRNVVIGRPINMTDRSITIKVHIICLRQYYHVSEKYAAMLCTQKSRFSCRCKLTIDTISISISMKD